MPSGARQESPIPAQTGSSPVGGAQKVSDPVNLSNNTANFKAQALSLDTLHQRAPSIFAAGPMVGVSRKYTFVPTARIVTGLGDEGWVPVNVEEQRIRTEARRGFQKHLLRFRRSEQMETLDEWNVELVLVNSHDAGCAYQLHAGIYRRICSNGLVMSEGSFSALRFRHSGLAGDEVVRASLRLLEFMPRVGELIQRFRARELAPPESLAFAQRALLLRYPSLETAPVNAETVLKAHRPEDEGQDVWHCLNRVQQNLIQGGVSDSRRDKRGKLRSVRSLRGIDSTVTLNKGLWGLAEQIVQPTVRPPTEVIALPA